MSNSHNYSCRDTTGHCSLDLGDMSEGLKPGITVIGARKHLKASEAYLDVVFEYPDANNWRWHGSVPYEYRRAGIFAQTKEQQEQLLNYAYDVMHPQRREAWIREQDAFWAGYQKEVTQAFFEALKDCEWKCQSCQLPPNPNWARRVQDIKELGYVLATDRRTCPRCKKSTTHLIMLRFPRAATQLRYEAWSAKVREQIIRVLGKFDAYENRTGEHLIPDHKFPEIRWDEETATENHQLMTEDEIRSKFQLITNQRNEQKREVCRNCFQTGIRGFPYGIRFFYEGDEKWPSEVPTRGKAAEKGCVGCGWYDLVKWRNELNRVLSNLSKRRLVEK